MAAPSRITTIAAVLLGAFLAFGPRGADGAVDADVLFDFDGDELTPQGEELLAELAESLVEEEDAPGATITIDGHTDALGSDSYNLDLSERRAAAVEEFLAEELDGVEVAFETAGHGAEQPAARNELGGQDNPLGRAKNRRVEIALAP